MQVLAATGPSFPNRGPNAGVLRPEREPVPMPGCHPNHMKGERPMRAAVLHNAGDEKVEIRDDVELEPISPGMVRVAIRATGVCHSDLSVMNGTIPQPPPCVLG